MNRIRTMATLTVAAALAGTSGCTAVDRAGGTADEPVRTLTFAQANDGEPPPQLHAWADEVERASDGTLSIEFANGWRGGEPGAERGIIADVAEGEADLGWVGARAFDRVGVTSFQALLAPMLVDSHALQRAVFEEGIPEEMLTGVDDAGVVGIGVLPGPMRKVLGLEKPFRQPGDFRGAVVGMQDSALTQAAMEAQGATTTAEPSGATLDGLDAYEQQLASIAGNGYVARARYVTGNLNLWPRPLVLIANPDTFDDLGDRQREGLRRASRDAVLPALDASSAEDGEGADELCVQGMELVEASNDELDALREAWEPLYGDLAADPDTARWLDRIEELKKSLGAEPDTATCMGSDDQPSDELTGVWTTELRAADWAAAGFEGPAGTWTLEFADGWLTGTQPDGVVGYRARYSAFRGRLVTSEAVDVLNAAYRVEGDQLYLTDVTVPGVDDGGPYAVVWATHPYTRAG